MRERNKKRKITVPVRQSANPNHHNFTMKDGDFYTANSSESCVWPSDISDMEAIERIIKRVREIITEKSAGYDSTPGEKFGNFRRAPVVTSGKLSIVQYCWVLANKHIGAMDDLLFAKNIDEYHSRGGRPMIRERIGDIIIFCIFLLAMLEKGKPEFHPIDSHPIREK